MEMEIARTVGWREHPHRQQPEPARKEEPDVTFSPSLIRRGQGWLSCSSRFPCAAREPEVTPQVLATKPRPSLRAPAKQSRGCRHLAPASRPSPTLTVGATPVARPSLRAPAKQSRGCRHLAPAFHPAPTLTVGATPVARPSLRAPAKQSRGCRHLAPAFHPSPTENPLTP